MVSVSKIIYVVVVRCSLSPFLIVLLSSVYVIYPFVQVSRFTSREVECGGMEWGRVEFSGVGDMEWGVLLSE